MSYIERKLNCANRISKARRILDQFTKELERSNQSNEHDKKTMKRQFDKKRQNLQRLKEGDNVWLEAKNIHLNGPLKKLDQKQYGSFKILKEISQEVFQLKLPKGWIIYNVFNEDLLT